MVEPVPCQPISGRVLIGCGHRNTRSGIPRRSGAPKPAQKISCKPGKLRSRRNLRARFYAGNLSDVQLLLDPTVGLNPVFIPHSDRLREPLPLDPQRILSTTGGQANERKPANGADLVGERNFCRVRGRNWRAKSRNATCQDRFAARLNRG